MDFTKFNPNSYSQEPNTRPFEELKNEIIQICIERSHNGIRGLGIIFRNMDSNGDHNLDPTEFKYMLRDFGVKISE
jgi:hypothetical protein